MKKHYELAYIVSIKFIDNDLTAEMEKVAGFIKEFNGDITADDILGRQRLAYPINHIHQGTYVVVEFDMEPEDVKELDGQLKLQTSILRHLIISKRIKTEEEIKREQEIQERLRQESAEELEQMEEENKKKVKKTEAPKVVKEAPKAEEVKTTEPAKEAKEVKVEEDKKSADKKINMEDIDKKIDEILTDDII